MISPQALASDSESSWKGVTAGPKWKKQPRRREHEARGAGLPGGAWWEGMRKFYKVLEMMGIEGHEGEAGEIYLFHGIS